MICIEFKFSPMGYHATPWGRHVNEGAIEWPPSPWRIMRALIAVGFRKEGWDPQNVPEEAKTLIEKFSYDYPLYLLPKGVPTHTKHYMPGYKDKRFKELNSHSKSQEADTNKNKKKDDKFNVIDSFLKFNPDNSLFVIWQKLQLDEKEKEMLKELINSLEYLGRKESTLINARFLDDYNSGFNCFPENMLYEETEDNTLLIKCPYCEEDIELEKEKFLKRSSIKCTNENCRKDIRWEKVKVLSPITKDRYLNIREGIIKNEKKMRLEKRREKEMKEGKDISEIRLSKKEEIDVDNLLPKTLFGALCLETSYIHRKGFSQPPATQWVDYLRVSDILIPKKPDKKIIIRKKDEPKVIILNVSADTKHGGGLPLVTDTIHVADTLRQALLKKSQDILGKIHSIFLGKDKINGLPSKEGHRHIFILPADSDGDGRIDMIILFAKQGFDKDSRLIISKVNKLWRPKNMPDIFVSVIAKGFPEDLGGFKGEKFTSPLLAKSRVWVSTTPYLLTRYPKLRNNGMPKSVEDRDWVIGEDNQIINRDNGNYNEYPFWQRWIDGPEDQLLRELSLRGFPKVRMIKYQEDSYSAGKRFAWRHFAKERGKGKAKLPIKRGYGFKIEFRVPVVGPLVFGYGAHFGMGQFIAEKG